MKKSLVLVFIFFVSIFSFSLMLKADSSQDDIIMKVSSSSNALGALWNVSDYGMNLLYSDFFGVNYYGDQVHECNGGNSILFLSQENDSNVSFREYESIYTIPGESSGEVLCQGTARLLLDGDVKGCRKGRGAVDYSLDVPVSFYSEPNVEKELVIQSNIAVRKQSNCGEFKWSFSLTCDSSGNLLVNGVSSKRRVSANPVKGKVSSGFTLISSLDKYKNYKNPSVYLNASFYQNPNENVKVVLKGDVKGCRKGRSTKDYEVDIPIYFNTSESDSKTFFVQSNIRVRKQANCGDFLWKFEVSKDNSGNLLVNGESGVVSLDWEKARVEAGFIKTEDLSPKYFGSGDSKNGYVNPAVFSIAPILEPEIGIEEIEQKINFNIPVCYGDASCNLREQNCEEGEILVASLEKDVESKISIRDDENYLYKICCFKDPSLNSDLYWANLLGEGINKTSLNDLVFLAVDWEIEGKEVNYTIYKEGELSWNPFNWFTKSIETISSDKDYPTWKPAEEGKYYFTASFEDGGIIKSLSSKNEKINNPYGILEVDSKINNSLPRVNIISPEDYSGFQVGSEIEFEAEYFDDDDDLKITWDFGDGSKIIRESCLTNGDCLVNYSYNKKGLFYVTATVEEMGRSNPQTAKQIVGVLIYDSGINLFPIIDKPLRGENFQRGLVEFDANDSFVANCTTLNSCIFPSQISPVKRNCYSVGTLKCFDYPDEVFDGKNYELYYNWTFSEGEALFGKFSEKKDLLVLFSKLFLEAKEHWAKLKIGFESLK